jgi:hypothetical protein
MIFLLKLGWIYIATFIIYAISMSYWYYCATIEAAFPKPSVKEWAKSNKFIYACIWLEGLALILLPIVIVAMIIVWVMSL